jgi:hypothetical protein
MVVGSSAEAKFPKYRVPRVLNFAVNEREPAGVDGAERHVGPHIAVHLQGLNACVRQARTSRLPSAAGPSIRPGMEAEGNAAYSSGQGRATSWAVMERGMRIMQMVSAHEPLKASKSFGFRNLWCGLCEDWDGCVRGQWGARRVSCKTDAAGRMLPSPPPRALPRSAPCRWRGTPCALRGA